MKKGIIFVLLVVFGVSVFYSSALAASSYYGSFFGGRIISPKATQIQTYESLGYICPTFGTTFSMVPIGSPAGTPTDYFIPAYVLPSTRTTIHGYGQYIIGRYTAPTFITCTLPTTPPDIKVVTLYSVDLYGTSR